MNYTISLDRLVDLRGKERKLERIEDAWENDGINPVYHKRRKAELRQDWNVLARALDAERGKR